VSCSATNALLAALVVVGILSGAWCFPVFKSGERVKPIVTAEYQEVLTVFTTPVV